MLLPALVFVAAMSTAASQDCPESWLEFEGRCLWASDFVVPWRSVAAACRLASPKSQPASVHSQFENAAIDSLLNGRQAWLGLSRAVAATDNFTWSDGSDLDFTYWNHGQPAKNGDCGVINANNVTGQWATVGCEQVQEFVCELRPQHCPKGWSLFGDTCYVLNSTHTVYGNAQAAACSDIVPGAEPVSIHSADVNAFLFSMINSTSSPWIGLQRTSSGGDYTWDDGSALNYTDWYSDPTYSSSNNVYMYYTNSKWQFDSYSRYRTFFCQIAA